MSFDLYVQAFKHGQPLGLSTHEVFAMFEGYATQVSSNEWKLEYDLYNSCSIFLGSNTSNKSQLESFTVHRPCRDIRLWNSLWNIMGFENVVLYFPGSHVLLRSETFVAHLPEGMLDALEGYVVVTSADKLLDELLMA